MLTKADELKKGFGTRQRGPHSTPQDRQQGQFVSGELPVAAKNVHFTGHRTVSMATRTRQRPKVCPECGAAAEYKGQVFRTLDRRVFECRFCGTVVDWS